MSEDTTPTHVRTSTGTSETRVYAMPNPDFPGNPFAGASAFSHLDGKRMFAESWAVLPEPFDGNYHLSDEQRDGRTGEYLQVGGRAKRMTFEMRRLVDGRYRQIVLGRKADVDREALEEDPAESIKISRHSQQVYPHEVWTSEQVTPVFRFWFEAGEMPGGLTIREIRS